MTERFTRETLKRLRTRYPYRGFFVVRKGEDPLEQSRKSVPFHLENEPGIYVVTALTTDDPKSVGEIVGIGCAGTVGRFGQISDQGLKTRILKGKKRVGNAKLKRWDKGGEFYSEIRRRGVKGLCIWWHVTIQKSAYEALLNKMRSDHASLQKRNEYEWKLHNVPRIVEARLLQRYLAWHGELPRLNRGL